MTLEERAQLAGQQANAINTRLQAASLVEDRTEKRWLISKAFTAYATLNRHMSILQDMAPNCAREGFEEAAKIHEFIEARAAG